MLLNKALFYTAIISAMLIFTACASSHKGPKPMDTRGKSPIYIKGAEDGCDTAKGDYTKDHDAFNNSIDYHEGWFAGRSYCQR